MNEIQYIGEHLLPGRLGHMALILAFVSGLLAAISYYFATNKRGTIEENNWKTIGRYAFIVHGLSIFAVIGVIFFIMTKQYYEYQYVWAHVSEDLPYQYIFSAFWEGQEGSFLLWLFWHIILGWILMVKGKQWEAPVLSVLAFVQVFIVSMILGVYVGFGGEAIKIGANPLLLLRDTMAAPIFAQADYVTQIKGNGLNPLLQNYWMTIHPPTLFLGFASTVIPFCFAIAGLWTRQHKAWLKPALPWALFSGAILGLGILMGGAWAYEALTFGGYWAWDPVENMSLVPWLILIAGIHTNLIAKTTGHSIRTTYIFYILTFIFIIYSTFLTRSGILGDTSVHAFTEMGLEWQLVSFLLTFTILPFALFLARMKGVESPRNEESSASKEFWMFIGTLVLLFSAVMITASTSLPVFNKIVQFFNPLFEGRVITDPVPHYNKYQLWIAVFMALLTGFAQFLRFKERNWKNHLKKFSIHMGIALVLATLLSLVTMTWIETNIWQYTVLLFSGWFTAVANLDYMITFLRGRLKLAGSAFSHLGFGLMLIGIIASGVNQRVISSNPFMMEGLIQSTGDESLRNNVMLIKDSPMLMEGYRVTYQSDTIEQFTRTYTVNFQKLDEEGNVSEEFNVYPNILYNKEFKEIAAYNPSTRHYLHKDIFTHISALPQVEMDFEYRRQREDSLNYKLYELPADGGAILFNDSLKIEQPDTTLIYPYRAFLVGINRNPSHPDYEPQPEDLAISAKIGIQRMDEDSVFYVEPVLVLRGQLLISYPEQVNEIISKVRLNEQIFNRVFTLEDQLEYETFTFKQGDQIEYKGKSIQFAGFNRQPKHPNYAAEEGDIAVSAIMSVQDENGRGTTAQPVFFIRNNQPFNIKAELPSVGLHFRFVKIDPANDSVDIMIAESKEELSDIPVEIATDSKRSDWIVMAAIEFPGINLFWLGTLLMLFGLTIAMWFRISSLKARN